MRDELTKIMAVSVALVMAASCVSLSIAGHATNNASFDDSLPTENLTDVPYHRMPINDAGHFDSHLEHIQRYDNWFSEENGFYFDSRHGYPGADRSLREFEADSSEQTPKEALTENVSQQTSGNVEQNGLRSVISQSSNTIYVPDEYAKIQWVVDNASVGDTIIVYNETAGAYYEYIVINGTLSLQAKQCAFGPVKGSYDDFKAIRGELWHNPITQGNVLPDSMIEHSTQPLPLDNSKMTEPTEYVTTHTTEDFYISSPENMNYILRDHRAINMPEGYYMEFGGFDITTYPYSGFSSLIFGGGYDSECVYDYTTNSTRILTVNGYLPGSGKITEVTKDGETYLFTANEFGGRGSRITENIEYLSYPISAIIDYPDLTRISLLNMTVPKSSWVDITWTLDGHDLYAFAKSTGKYLYYVNLTNPELLDLSKNHEISLIKELPYDFPLNDWGRIYELNNDILLIITYGSESNDYVFYNLADDSWKVFQGDGYNVVWHREEGDSFYFMLEKSGRKYWWESYPQYHNYKLNRINLTSVYDWDELTTNPVETLWMKHFTEYQYTRRHDIVHGNLFYLLTGYQDGYVNTLDSIQTYDLVTGELINGENPDINLPVSNAYLSKILYPYLDISSVWWGGFIFDFDRKTIHPINLSTLVDYVNQETGVGLGEWDYYSFYLADYDSSKSNLLGMMYDWTNETTYLTSVDVEFGTFDYTVGQGAPTEAIKNHFIDAYNRNGGINVLGSPTTAVHKAWGYWVQDFPGASGYAGGIIMYNPYKNYAYYIHGAIWDRYYSLGGPNAETDIEFELGLPICDIVPYVHTHPPAVSSHGTQFRYQNFEGGALDLNVDTGAVLEIHGTIFAKWRELGYAAGDLGLVTSDEQEAVISAIGTEGRVSDFEGGHIHWHRNGALANTAFETHGAIDAVYCSEDGSGGWLGFPVSNEYVNPSGYAQSDFEEGYITTTDGVIYEAFVYANNPPTNLAQFKSDSTTEIPVGGTTDERTVSFKGTVSDPDGDMVKLQVELRRLDEYGGQFDETKGGLKDSGFVASGSEAVAYAEELIDADYHWRARAVDEHGDSSAWQEFGGNDISEADFWVNVINLPHADAGGLYYYGNVNEPIQFHGLATGGTPPYTYVWEFFDLDASETVIGPNPTHTWSTKGSYLAKLLVQDSAGGSNKKLCIVFVFRSDPQLEKYAPVLYFDKDEKFYPTIINASLDHSELKDQYGYVLDNPVTVDDLKPYDDEDCYLDMTIVDMTIVWLTYKQLSPLQLFPPGFYEKVAPDPKHFENYPSNIYARKEIVGADIVLQYWLFYPYNLGTLNAHEGDWELIQVLLDCNENPYRVTYSWHKTFLEFIYGGMTYEWSEVEKVSNTHPKVYVNKGSHANNKEAKRYFIVGTFEIGKIIYPKGVDVDGSDKEKLDYFTIIDDQTQWINWKGKWGEQVYKLSLFGDKLDPHFSGGSGPKYINSEYRGEVNVNIWQEPILWMQECNDGWLKVLGYSPINIHIYDQYNHHAVLTENGIFESEIPGAYYFEPEQAVYLTDINEYRIFVEATDEGEFGLDIVRKTVNETTLIQYQNISITQNTTANMSINQTTTHYTMEIDIDGDGVVNEVKFPDSIETDYAPTATIILPVNESVHHYGTEIVFSGTGTDLEDGILINYSLVWYSSIDGYIDIGNTFTNANLSARTHLIELMVNDSSGQIGMENVTITVIAPDLTIDASNISFSNPYPVEGENITINATIHNIGTANAASVTVQFFDGNPMNGTQIGANQTIAMINAGENKNVSVAWNTSGEAGDNCIWVVVDPSDSIKEPDEENNQANKSIFVGAPDVLHILNAQTDRAVYLGYEAVLINCVVENASGNISANVSADIEKPDGIIDNITLIEGLIGNYNGAFTNTSLSGIYSITINANRTGFIGDTESLNFEVLDTTHPASITNLTHTIGATWINWTWDNPPDPDFEYTLIYLNGTWNTITAKGYQFIEGLDASTEYELGTQTVDAEGNMNENWVNQTARTSEIQLPIANFTYTPENPVVTQLITFNASNSTDPDGTITNYEWDFGDGNVTNTTEAIINHSYASTGVYTVNLTVTDNDCATNTKTKLITVTRLCGDVAPYPNSNGEVNMGDVIRLLNHVGYPGNTTYTLCNDWAGDCRCTGVRNMGDVVLLLNNVSYPENPRYVLDCC